MTTDKNDPPRSTAPLSEAQRAAAFGAHLSTPEHPSVMSGGRFPVPPKFIVWMIVAFLVLGLGGAVVEHYFGNIGVTPTTTTLFKLPPTPTTPSGSSLSASLSSFIGLKEIGSAQAAPFVLLDQAKREWSLTGARGKVVVLTFYNTNCNDICPVLGAEIKQAASLVAQHGTNVEFVIVNSDPNHYQFNATPLALLTPSLDLVPNVHFLTGPLPQLNAVWISYGLAVRVGVNPNQVTHNNIIYFIDPRGRLRAQAVPFGNEDQSGQFSLNAADIHRYAQGIAQTADSLVK